MRIASSNRSAPIASALAVYSGVSNAHMNMALGSEIVDLVGVHLLNETDEICRIGQISIVHEEANVALMRIMIEMIHTACIERGRPPLHAMHNVTFVKQQSAKVAAVLARNSRDECALARHSRVQLI